MNSCLRHTATAQPSERDEWREKQTIIKKSPTIRVGERKFLMKEEREREREN
jgi:hypothetical protein